MTERRDRNRLPLELNVDHILGEQQFCQCVTEDLSLDGMRLRRLSNDGWGAPRHAWLQFRIPGDEGPAIRALGELRHEETSDGSPCRGFRFKYINPRARRRYEAFVSGALQAA